MIDAIEVPFEARHTELSLVASLDDDPARADERLLDTALSAISYARSVSLTSVTARMSQKPFWTDVWPGEHYKLLAGIVLATKPRCIVEIGTYLGLSALSLLQHLSPRGQLVTYDLVPWNEFGDSYLRRSDFEGERLLQRIGNLSVDSFWASEMETIQKADLIFIDGPKDGVFERRLLEKLRGLMFRNAPLLVFDDIRLWNMLAVWRDIRVPKLDLTSFGHWSGTGLVHWKRTNAP